MSKIDKVPEKEFIELCRRGKTVKEIGEIFGISRDSVRRIKNNLRERGINIENENKERYRDTLPIGEIIRYYELKNKNTGSSVMTLDEIAAKYGVTRTTISTIVNEYYESIGKDRPERHGGWQISKLPRKDIYEAWKNGTSQYVLAEQYNVTRPNIDFLIKAYCRENGIDIKQIKNLKEEKRQAKRRKEAEKREQEKQAEKERKQAEREQKAKKRAEEKQAEKERKQAEREQKAKKRAEEKEAEKERKRAEREQNARKRAAQKKKSSNMVSKQNMLNEQEKAREGKNKEDNPNLENDSSKLADIEPKSRYLTLKEREKRALDYEHRVMLFEYLERGLSVEQIEEIAEKNNISISPRLKASLLNKYSEIENDQTVKEDKIVAVDHEDYE